MSSKSRKHSSPPARKTGHTAEHGHAHASGSSGPHEGELEHAEPTAKDFLDAEEILKTPKGHSPLAYALMVLLLIFLVLIFLLPPDVMSGNGGARANPVVARYTLPGEEPTELRYREMIEQKQAYDGLVRTMRSNARVDDAMMARVMLLDDLAIGAGITVSDEELREELRPLVEGYGSSAALAATMNNFGGVDVLSEMYRKVLRGLRYEQLTRALLEVPSGDDVRERWEQDRKEYAFDAVVLSQDDYLEAARADAPTDAELEEWLAARPAFQLTPFQDPVAHWAELIGLAFDAEAEDWGAELLAVYPEPEAQLPAEGEEPAPADSEEPPTEEERLEQLAKSYYDRYFFARFRKPEGEPAAVQEGEEEAEPAPQEAEFLPYEDVAAIARREALVMGAFDRWLKETQAALAEEGAELDLLAEAQRLGLTYLRPEGPLDREGWGEYDSDLVGSSLAGQMGRLTEPGQLLPNVVVEGGGLAVPRLIEKREAVLKPIAEIREEVLEQWLPERALELATTDLEALREDLVAISEESADDDADEPSDDATEDAADDLLDLDSGNPSVTAEQFAAAAEARGLSVGRRDYLPRNTTAENDPQFEDPLHAALRGSFTITGLEEGELSGVESTSSRDGMFLARLEGSRPEPIERMTMSDYQGFQQSLELTRRFELASSGPLSEESLVERYELWSQAAIDAEERDAETARRRAERAAKRAERLAEQAQETAPETAPENLLPESVPDAPAETAPESQPVETPAETEVPAEGPPEEPAGGGR